MNGDREKIYSNEYADFILNYNGDMSILELYRDTDINIINYFFAVVHFPVGQMSEDIVSKVGYSSLPLLFGLESEASMEASGIPSIRNVPSFNLKGKGVLIGIADSGIDYTNPIFQYADKTTRIARIWDQTIVSENKQEGLVYGTEYTREQINEAIVNIDPYSIVPSKDDIGHGTMVAGIAAGNEVPESGFYGVAPDSELVIVKLKPAKPYLKKFFRVPDSVIAYQENDIIYGIQYLLNYAIEVNKPIVICIAIDTSQYAHDSRNLTSTWLSFQASYPGIAILLPAGNEGNTGRHYTGWIDESTRADTVELNVGANESGFTMEFWGMSPNIFTLDILSPSGEYIPKLDFRYNETRRIAFLFDATVIYADNQTVELGSGEQLIMLRFSNPAQGIWRFKIYSRGIFPIRFDLWLPMNDFITYNTYFIKPNPNTTLLSLACTTNPITVTAYNPESNGLYINAGRGYTRSDLIKPDIAAPGVNLISPSLDHGFYQVTGTSAAVAHTSGVSALLFEWGIVNGNFPNMNSVDMKIFMIRGAKRIANIKYPNQDWGYGILDLFNIFNSIRSGV
ncbi:S8 family peptidase [Anaerocolumna sp. MB42-C2]|uniref:S8 family peptidase n=1 Tax=Anaerocolumna sp. MB42-C2 TaxID=3070997 RepID=UPI0027DFB84C|nr:S8 family peptidase [Anaerocolumna sp. MB42-C2]WMJ87042.1 S8 family peptidase [Anaerocolumna sp. MB42-C2]